MRWLEKIPTLPLLLVAIVLAVLPVTPEPHLWEKLKMLMAGELSKPIDIFDLILHGGPLCLVAIKVLVTRSRAK